MVIFKTVVDNYFLPTEWLQDTMVPGFSYIYDICTDLTMNGEGYYFDDVTLPEGPTCVDAIIMLPR